MNTEIEFIFWKKNKKGSSITGQLTFSHQWGKTLTLLTLLTLRLYFNGWDQKAVPNNSKKKITHDYLKSTSTIAATLKFHNSPSHHQHFDHHKKPPRLDPRIDRYGGSNGRTVPTGGHNASLVVLGTVFTTATATATASLPKCPRRHCRCNILSHFLCRAGLSPHWLDPGCYSHLAPSSPSFEISFSSSSFSRRLLPHHDFFFFLLLFLYDVASDLFTIASGRCRHRRSAHRPTPTSQPAPFSTSYGHLRSRVNEDFILVIVL